MSDSVKESAERISEIAENYNVGIEPFTVITIMTQVLPLLVSCFRRNDQNDPQQVAAEVRKQNQSAPQLLRRRLARRIRGEAEQPMTREQSFQLAEATIQHVLESEDGHVAAVCAAVRDE